MTPWGDWVVLAGMDWVVPECPALAEARREGKLGWL